MLTSALHECGVALGQYYMRVRYASEMNSMKIEYSVVDRANLKVLLNIRKLIGYFVF